MTVWLPNDRMHLTAASGLSVPSGRRPEAAGDAERWAATKDRKVPQ